MSITVIYKGTKSSSRQFYSHTLLQLKTETDFIKLYSRQLLISWYPDRPGAMQTQVRNVALSLILMQNPVKSYARSCFAANSFSLTGDIRPWHSGIADCKPSRGSCSHIPNFNQDGTIGWYPLLPAAKVERSTGRSLLPDSVYQLKSSCRDRPGSWLNDVERECDSQSYGIFRIQARTAVFQLPQPALNLLVSRHRNASAARAQGSKIDCPPSYKIGAAYQLAGSIP